MNSQLVKAHFVLVMALITACSSGKKNTTVEKLNTVDGSALTVGSSTNCGPGELYDTLNGQCVVSGQTSPQIPIGEQPALDPTLFPSPTPVPNPFFPDMDRSFLFSQTLQMLKYMDRCYFSVLQLEPPMNASTTDVQQAFEMGIQRLINCYQDIRSQFQDRSDENMRKQFDYHSQILKIMMNRLGKLQDKFDRMRERNQKRHELAKQRRAQRKQRRAQLTQGKGASTSSAGSGSSGSASTGFDPFQMTLGGGY